MIHSVLVTMIARSIPLGARHIQHRLPRTWSRGRIRVPIARAQMQSGMQKMERRKAALEIWKRAEAVCFDVDSTLIQEESIDELADFLGMGEKVAEVTSKAMSGDMKFEEALSLRLGAMQPSRSDVCRYLKERPPRVTTGIKELIQELQSRQTTVYLISGGFRDIINPIAEKLDIDTANIYANTILYNEDGSYAGFDSREFTSRSGGKAQAVKTIKDTHGHYPMVMIGDGATDLEARTLGAVELFIGYGGVIERPLIAEKADWFITDINDLLNALMESNSQN